MDRNKQKKHTVAQTGAENNIKIPNLWQDGLTLNIIRISIPELEFCFGLALGQALSLTSLTLGESSRCFCSSKATGLGFGSQETILLPTWSVPKPHHLLSFFFLFFFPQPRQEFKKKCVITISIVISCNFSSVSHQQDIQYSSEE